MNLDPDFHSLQAVHTSLYLNRSHLADRNEKKYSNNSGET